MNQEAAVINSELYSEAQNVYSNAKAIVREALVLQLVVFGIMCQPDRSSNFEALQALSKTNHLAKN